jgi:hypothetical protein
VAVVTVKALACELPAETGVPLSRWSAPDLAVEAVARGVVESISASTVRRWLAGDALRACWRTDHGSLTSPVPRIRKIMVASGVSRRA